MWIIESTWTPLGLTAYVTFLVDPFADVHSRKKNQDVWAILVSRTRPAERMHPEGITISLGSGWAARVPEVIKYLSDVRSAHAFG